MLTLANVIHEGVVTGFVPEFLNANSPIQIHFSALWVKSLIVFLVLERGMTP